MFTMYFYKFFFTNIFLQIFTKKNLQIYSDKK